MNAADGISERIPEVTDWHIGGHSLGGAMAANYAAKHTEVQQQQTADALAAWMNLQ